MSSAQPRFSGLQKKKKKTPNDRSLSFLRSCFSFPHTQPPAQAYAFLILVVTRSPSSHRSASNFRFLVIALASPMNCLHSVCPHLELDKPSLLHTRNHVLQQCIIDTHAQFQIKSPSLKPLSHNIDFIQPRARSTFDPECGEKWDD